MSNPEMVKKDLLLKITYNYECIKMLKCQHFHYIDVKSNEQCQWGSPRPDSIIRQRVSPCPVLKFYVY
jgi:hypothetical protein